MNNKLIALLLALATSFALTACSDDGKDKSSDIPESAEFNQADVDFATDMIQHHSQALVMVDLTEGRDLSPDLTQLAEQIRAAQGPEIETMADWLTDWEQPIPETMRDHANAHSDGEVEHSGVPGMLSQDQLDELEAAQGDDFEQMWLESMIEHHEGAIEMAKTEQADGEYPDAIDLAGTIATTQQDEIDEMEAMLGS